LALIHRKVIFNSLVDYRFYTRKSGLAAQDRASGVLRGHPPQIDCRAPAIRLQHLHHQCGCPLSLPIPAGYMMVMTGKLDQVFAALADPTRRAILAMLLEDDMAVTDVAEPFEMSLAAISKHLNVLMIAGLISQEKRGRVKWCKLEPDAMRDASIWMQGFGQFEPVHLDAFERFLETELCPVPPKDT
jgi:DNA-binding transcriptional ArsR family regulator